MTIPPVPTYSIELEFYNSENEVCSSHIKAFLAEDHKDAILSAIRFWEGRQRAYSEHFGKLLCLKVYRAQVGIINTKGELTSKTLWGIFEWKYDFPGSLPDHVELRLAELDKMKNVE